MDLKRYQGIDYIEYEGVQLTPENMEEVANYFHLEYVKNYVDEDGVEEAMFRPGHSFPILVGDFVVQTIHGEKQAGAVLAGDFDSYYTEIKEHAFVPQITHSTDDNYPSPCVFCGNERHSVPYHRDMVPGETITLPDGNTLVLKAT